LEFAKTIDPFNVTLEQAIGISEKFSIPLHPKFIYYWKEISKESFSNLLDWINSGLYEGKIILPYTRKDKEIFAEGKRALELIGLPHEVTTENVVISPLESKTLLLNLGINLVNKEKEFLLKDFFKLDTLIDKSGVLEIINFLSKIEIKDKSGEFIGSRMGRPEKAKLRKLIGSPNVLFSVGSQGGRLRSVQATLEVGKIMSQFPLYHCPVCKKETIYRRCESCDGKTERRYYFYDLKEKTAFEKFEGSEKKGIPYMYRELDIVELYNRCREKLKMTKDEMPSLIKGVRGVSSDEKALEHLCKGILRAKYDLQVNKDGTIRMDATELPLVAFKPKEIGTSVEKLNSLGYDLDVYGNPLTNEEQIVELMPHDILIPSAMETPDERGEDVFLKICNFMDDLLEKFYGLKKFYNIKTREDLIGQLGVFMAPHNCAGVVCRFIGFSKTLGVMASPYMHAAVRRDCDGDEAAIMLLGDVLLNFSRKYLPSHRGGTQDAPLVLNAKIDAGEVDDQILDFEFVFEYPLDLYKKAEQRVHSSEVSVYNVKKILKEGKNPFQGAGFTHDTTDFNDGVVCSSYKLLGSMQEKVNHQMALVERIRAVDTSDTARLIIERHFIRDMRGNLRNFSVQNFRCVACNEIARRVPLAGVCPACGGKLIFTIHEGGIKKYLEPALELSKKYNLSPYLKQTLELVKGYIDSIFGKEREKQESIDKWF
jgi:DNA polymerase II large subunit